MPKRKQSEEDLEQEQEEAPQPRRSSRLNPTAAKSKAKPTAKKATRAAKKQKEEVEEEEEEEEVEVEEKAPRRGRSTATKGDKKQPSAKKGGKKKEKGGEEDEEIEEEELEEKPTRRGRSAAKAKKEEEEEEEEEIEEEDVESKPRRGRSAAKKATQEKKPNAKKGAKKAEPKAKKGAKKQAGNENHHAEHQISDEEIEKEVVRLLKSDGDSHSMKELLQLHKAMATLPLGTLYELASRLAFELPVGPPGSLQRTCCDFLETMIFSWEAREDRRWRQLSKLQRAWMLHLMDAEVGFFVALSYAPILSHVFSESSESAAKIILEKIIKKLSHTAGTQQITAFTFLSSICNRSKKRYGEIFGSYPVKDSFYSRGWAVHNLWKFFPAEQATKFLNLFLDSETYSSHSTHMASTLLLSGMNAVTPELAVKVSQYVIAHADKWVGVSDSPMPELVDVILRAPEFTGAPMEMLVQWMLSRDISIYFTEREGKLHKIIGSILMWRPALCAALDTILKPQAKTPLSQELAKKIQKHAHLLFPHICSAFMAKQTAAPMFAGYSTQNPLTDILTTAIRLCITQDDNILDVVFKCAAERKQVKNSGAAVMIAASFLRPDKFEQIIPVFREAVQLVAAPIPEDGITKYLPAHLKDNFANRDNAMIAVIKSPYRQALMKIVADTTITIPPPFVDPEDPDKEADAKAPPPATDPPQEVGVLTKLQTLSVVYEMVKRGIKPITPDTDKFLREMLADLSSKHRMVDCGDLGYKLVGARNYALKVPWTPAVHKRFPEEMRYYIELCHLIRKRQQQTKEQLGLLPEPVFHTIIQYVNSYWIEESWEEWVLAGGLFNHHQCDVLLQIATVKIFKQFCTVVHALDGWGKL